MIWYIIIIFIILIRIEYLYKFFIKNKNTNSAKYGFKCSNKNEWNFRTALNILNWAIT